MTDVVDTAAVDAEGVMVSAERSDALKPSISYVVIDCSSMMFIDCVGTTTIQQVSVVTDVS